MENKLKKLGEILDGCGPMLVALSGGVDSVFLLAFAYERALAAGMPDRVAALTAVGPQFPQDETGFAEEFCDSLGISHKQVDASYIVNMIKRNPEDRCYHCKRELFSLLKERADMVGSLLVDGTNATDMEDYRPGYKAITELGIGSPLKEAELTKDEIRRALKELSIGNASSLWDKPACACLITRIPYGETVTVQKLEAIYEAEKYLKSRGFTQVRVRCHEIAGKVSGSAAKFMARIEILPEEAGRLLQEKAFAGEIEAALKALGFEYVTVDLGGYEKGKMNSVLEEGRLAKDTDAPDRIKVTETVTRGSASKVETADIMKAIDDFLAGIDQKDYSFEEFAGIIRKLRQPDGCPWDRAQTHESLKKHMVEEVNETLEAIDEGDRQHLCEELGDVLLQIVLHAQIASEAGDFSIDDVINSASKKMIRRHPHVFGNIDVSGIDEGLDLWEEIKKREKAMK